MKSFGNMVCSGMTVKPYLNLKRYKEVADVEDRSLPTLVVGWAEAKKCIPEVNILQKWYPELNMGWIFSRNERSEDSQNDLTAFCDWILKRTLSDCTYRLVDVVNISLTDTKKFLKFVNNPSPKYVFVDRNNFLFIYSRKHKRTYGISLSTCRYCGMDSDKIIRRVLCNPANERLRSLSAIPTAVRQKLGDNLHQYFPILEYFL